MTLNDIEAGKHARVEAVGGEGALRQHLLDMGVIPGVVVKVVKFAPMGDPIEIMIHGYELTLRLSDAENITVTRSDAKESDEKKDYQSAMELLRIMDEYLRV